MSAPTANNSLGTRYKVFQTTTIAVTNSYPEAVQRARAVAGNDVEARVLGGCGDYVPFATVGQVEIYRVAA